MKEESISRDDQRPRCAMSHNFINNLTVIVGSCELLKEAEQTPECKRRLEVIWEVAHKMVEELKTHQCQLDAVTKIVVISGRGTAPQVSMRKASESGDLASPETTPPADNCAA